MRAIGWTFLMLLGAGLLASTVKAAEFARQTDTDGLVIISLSGEIVEKDDEKFLQLIHGVNRAVVVLQSNGGSLYPALTMGRAIKASGFATLVPDNAICASACAMIWLGGAKRYSSSSAQIGFHAAYRERYGFATESGSGNAIVGSYYASLGLSDEAIYYLTSSAPGDMFWIDADKARELGIEIAVIPSSAPAETEQSAPAGIGYWFLRLPAAVIEGLLK